MITGENIDQIVQELKIEDKKLIANSNSEYVTLECCIHNAGAVVIVGVVNDFPDEDEYEELLAGGGCILEKTDSVFQTIIEEYEL